MTIKDTVRNLARQYPISIPNLEKELGFGTGTISRWDKSFPGVDKMQAVADFFGVTVDYLLGRETGTKKKLPDLTPKDEREITKQLENMMNSLDDETAFAAVGGTAEDENDRELLRASLEMALRISKQIAKKKYTPKRFQKDRK
ncbi:MAG: transcriptional regulator [Negativicoccus succinicivorans]|uniref:transcriptional regulator n=1 Tax=Negativicoccus succinicivorans TaxID=620903 RepID=UPI0029032CB8|nr:transcriptional regulator [Negativicoccus succinicivorans]MDU2644198.1 transcriptional regulator [Negativicoccus succinicivorans]MDU5657388.1 transcriptional regulator [Negativicoccus succinicivorans]